jgi:uncharacterized membrane protein YdjX (TVP38/TMEM64 family)
VTGRPRRLWLAAAVLLALGLATALVWIYALGAAMPLPGFELSVEAVEAEIQAFGIWGVAVAILLMVLHSFVPFPAELVAMANGMLFGLVITWTGAMLGAYLAFGLARGLGRPFVHAMVGERQRAAIDRWAERQGAGILLFSRLVPVISFNLVNYAAGLTAISWWTFTWTTGLGILPLTCLMVVVGDRLWSGEGRSGLRSSAVCSGGLWRRGAGGRIAGAESGAAKLASRVLAQDRNGTGFGDISMTVRASWYAL